jgi:tRNA pseudouridine32 synthase/23S rRNA pseudouridine746 synthase
VRVHAASLGAPVRGDTRYGQPSTGLHLLSRSIHLPLAPAVAAIAEPPPHMRAALRACGWQG